MQALTYILQVSVPFFFDGAPQMADHVAKGAAAPSPAYVSGFLADSGGLRLVRALTHISDPALRRSVVRFVEQIVAADDC